jgi:phosphonopyruvate decarboxylase
VIEASAFLKQSGDRGFSLFTGVPCSYLQGFINYVIGDDSLQYIAAANEGDAVAIAAGSSLGGRRAVCMFQNSGLGNAVNPLTSLTSPFRIPVLLIVTHRGEPGARQDEPQHDLMGRVTTDLLELMGVGWERFPAELTELPAVLDRVDRWMERSGTPYALVMPEGTVESWPAPEAVHPGLLSVQPTPPPLAPTSTRREVLTAIQETTRPDDIVVAATGYTGRELYGLDDRPNQFYMVGSMGCASSLGLGLAVAHTDRRVIVIDGDGAALMRLGALSTVGAERPQNLIHIVLDNGQHESTGGQSTNTRSTDLAAVAAACSYPGVERVAKPEALADLLNMDQGQCLFVHVPIVPGVEGNLPRPTVSPAEVADRLRDHLDPERASAERPVVTAAPPVTTGSPRRRRCRILIVTAVDEPALEQLRSDHDVIQVVDVDDEQLRRLIVDREMVIFRSGVQMSAEVMRSAPRLVALIRAGSGLDNLDLEYVAQAGITLHRIPEPGAKSVAELAFGLMLTLARRLPTADRLLREGVWAKHRMKGDLLAGKTLGVYGAGNIGGAVGDLGVAWGMTVLGCVETPTDDRVRELRARRIELVTPSELLSQADFVVLSVPLGPKTHYIIGVDELALMKPGAYLINVARGGVLDEDAAAAAIRSGHLAGVGLDVHEQEGDNMTSPMFGLSNVVLTPHIGAGTVDAQRMIGRRILEIVAEFAADSV